MGGKAVIIFCRLFFCYCFALGDIIQKIMASFKKKILFIFCSKFISDY